MAVASPDQTTAPSAPSSSTAQAATDGPVEGDARIADVVAATLKNYGVQHAFGIPGGEVLTLIDALKSAGLRFVLTRHETPAATMAAGVSTVTGAPGLLVTTVGPGLANAVNAIADANQERVPLIVLTGVVDHAVRHRYTHQVLNQAALLATLVKGSFEIEAEGAGSTLARALDLALTAPFGPVHVDLAPGTAARIANAEDRPGRPAERLAPGVDLADPAIARVAEALAQAERPVVIAGFEAARAGAGDAVRVLCEKLRAPLVTTYKAKGLVDERHDLCLGGAGLSPLADRHLMPLLQAADAVVLVDYDPIEMRQGWLEPFATGARIIEICHHPYDHGMHRADVRIAGTARAVCNALCDNLPAGSPGWPDGRPAAVRGALKEAFAGPDDWGAHAAFRALEKAVPDSAVITVDSGAHRILLSQMLNVRRPLGLLQSAGFCTMGVALPLAAGAKAAVPERAAVAVLGDGGLEMGLGELATLRDEKLPIVIVVMQDQSLALIELKQRQMALSRHGVGLGATPFEDIARAYGGHGARVRSSSAFAAELETALTREAFSLIVCEIGADDYAGAF